MSRVTTSVVVCAWTVDRWSQMVAALASALDQRPRPDQVVLVVDHSDELLSRSAAIAGPAGPGDRQHGVPRSVGRPEHRRGTPPPGRWCCSSTTTPPPHPGWLAGHVRHYEDPDVLGVGGLVVPAWADRRPGLVPS